MVISSSRDGRPVELRPKLVVWKSRRIRWMKILSGGFAQSGPMAASKDRAKVLTTMQSLGMPIADLRRGVRRATPASEASAVRPTPGPFRAKFIWSIVTHSNSPARP